MRIRRGFRYRLFPTPEQEARLRCWEGALRALWNTAHSQRLVLIERGAKMPSAFDQINEGTELRAAVPWLAAVPRNACAQVLINLDLARQRSFSGLARRPRWKRKGRDRINLTEQHPRQFRLTTEAIVFPKLGAIHAALHRPIMGTPKQCTIRREVDQWFAVVQCESVVPDPTPRTAPVVAIDRGVRVLLADSEGARVQNPKFLERTLRRLARAQRVVGRRRKGSHRWRRSVQRVGILHRKGRRQRQHLLHVLSNRYANSHGVVVVERLNVQGMVRGRLGRQIADAGWSTFVAMLRYKLQARGGTLAEVPAAYSSQTCSVCARVDAASRDAGQFDCVACGHRDHRISTQRRCSSAVEPAAVLAVEGKAQSRPL